MTTKFKSHKKSIIVILSCLVLNMIASFWFFRIDYTPDKRYTLSDSTKVLAKSITSPLVIDIFLDGELNPDFDKLKNETIAILEEYENLNGLISFQLLNPLASEELRESNIQQLVKRGLTPLELSTKKDGKLSQQLIFPWALVSYNKKTTKINLLKNDFNANEQGIITSSIQQLEYVFSDAIKKLTTKKADQKKIAVLKGNLQLKDIYIADFLKTLGSYYRLAEFTLDSVQNSPSKTLNQIMEYDLVINANPREAFSASEKYVLDQFIMHGGKSLWLTNGVVTNKDSLMFNKTSLAIPKELNISDLLFTYGIRVNKNLVSSSDAALTAVISGKGSKRQFVPRIFPYAPLAKANNNHPITKNITDVKLEFASQIDTLKNKLKKTILLKSTSNNEVFGVPKLMSLDQSIANLNTKKSKNEAQNLAVLIEGKFPSTFRYKVKPFNFTNHLDQSSSSAMIIASSGNLIKNDIDLKSGGPLELGFDKWSGITYGNKEFLLNAVNYLLDDIGLMNIRNKDININYLNPELISKQKTKYKLINTLIPVVLLFITGIIFNVYIRKKYKM
jgi:ABC-2 type transport system permease protein